MFGFAGGGFAAVVALAAVADFDACVLLVLACCFGRRSLVPVHPLSSRPSAPFARSWRKAVAATICCNACEAPSSSIRDADVVIVVVVVVCVCILFLLLLFRFVPENLENEAYK